MTLLPTAIRTLAAAASATLAALLLAGSLAAPAAADSSDDCAAAITKLTPMAEQLTDAGKKTDVERLLKQAHEELVTEGDPEECMDKVADAKDVLGAAD